MSPRPRDPARGDARARKPAPHGAPPASSASLPARHPAVLTAALAAASILALLVTFPLVDTDFWQHLSVGRAMWSTHSIPMLNVWTWPTWGEPQVLPSWGFRALLWPFYALGGVTGLYVWRWVTTLAAFALLWAAARRMGATGFTPLVTLILCVLVYRLRSQVRPETLVAVLLALEIWILESRRHRAGVPEPQARGAPRAGRDWTPWLVVIAWVWANVHISYYLGLVLIGIHLVAGRFGPPGRPASGSRPGQAMPLGRVLLAAAAVSFINPFGARALAQPFEYFFVWRHEFIYRTIGELKPIDWSDNLTNGLPLVLFGWPLLALWRARRIGVDWVEMATAALFVGLALASQRFLGPMSIAAAPYLARDVEDWVRARRWPAWSGAPWNRAALAIAGCAALTPMAWPYADLRPGIGIAPEYPPQAACDFIAAHGVRGRAFNPFEFGGYLLWRFWPERERLPFMDIHQTGTRQDRLDIVGVMLDANVWHDLDKRHRFEWALLKRVHSPDDRSLEFVETDPDWALVFADDAAALFVRRHGALAAVADSFAYALAPAGTTRRNQLAAACFDDDALRARAEAELRRMAAASAYNSTTLSLLASMLMLDGRWAESRDALERAHRVDPQLPLYRERLRTIEEALKPGAR